MKSKRFQKQSSSQGFTLPTAMGMGFILMLITVATLERARNEQIISSSRSRSELSMAVTEAGVARFQSFLDRQRLLVTRDAANWSTDLMNLANNLGSCVAQHEAQAYSQRDWWSLPTGRYRIRNYSYRSQPGSAGQIGIGKLLLEGQTTAKPNQASSLLAVDIPVSLNPTTLPALWATSINLDRDQRITGNVRVHACPDSTGRVLGVRPENITVGDTGQPTGSVSATIFPWPQARPRPYRYLDLPMISKSQTLPFPGDLPDEQGVYHYAVSRDINNDSIKLAASEKLQVNLKPGEAVNLYVAGNLSIQGQILAIDAATQELQPQKLRIYGGIDTKEISLFDSATITAMIHAPLADGRGYQAAKAGQGLTGILWLKSWNSDHHHSRLSIIQAGSWSDLEIPAEERLGVRIHPPSSWQRRDVNNP
jgi:Tfp pilus assembly protein PilX